MVTRCAFLSSIRFLTVHGPPRHDGSFAMWLKRIEMSDATRF